MALHWSRTALTVGHNQVRSALPPAPNLLPVTASPTSIFLTGHQLPRLCCICKEAHFSSLARHWHRAGQSASHFVRDVLRDSRQTLRACDHMARFMQKQERSGKKSQTNGQAHPSPWLLFSAVGHRDRAGGFSLRSRARGSALPLDPERRLQGRGGRRPSGAGSPAGPPGGVAPGALPAAGPAGSHSPAPRAPSGPAALVRSQRRSFPRHLRRETHIAASHFHDFVASGISWIRGRFIRTPCGCEEVSSQGQCGVNYILSTPPLLIGGYKKYKRGGRVGLGRGGGGGNCKWNIWMNSLQQQKDLPISPSNA